MKKNDLIIYFVIAILFILSIIFTFSYSEKGETVKIYVDKEFYAEYSIAENNSYTIEGVDGLNLLLNICDGSVSVSEATCSDKICESTGRISKTNDAIICLPGRIVISIDSSDEAEFDSISR